MNKGIVFLLLLLCCSRVVAVPIITISGFVTDSQTGEALIGATVFCTASQKACATNEFGFYSLSLPANNGLTLAASFIGYQTEYRPIDGNVVSLNFKLNPGVDLCEVVVEAQTRRVTANENMNVIRMDMKTVKQLPTTFGENDLMQALRLMPGVQSGSEGKSQLFVRGGSADQNLMLLDDVPLYYVSHFGGFFSVFNSDALNNVELTKGGFPARYGGRLSSVLDVRMKEGNLDHFEGNATVGMLSSRITLEGPLKKDTSSYLISARKSIVPLMAMITDNFTNGFYDLNAKLNFKLNNENRLLVSFYNGRDNTKVSLYENNKLGNTPTYSNKANWGHLMGAFRWNHIFSGKLFSNLTLSSVRYNYSTKINFNEKLDSIQFKTTNKLFSGIVDVNANYDLNWYVSPNYTIRGGIKNTYHIYTPNNEELTKEASSKLLADTSYYFKINALESSAYIENSFNFKKIEGNAGARLATYFVEGESYYYIEPRVQFSFLFSNNIKFNASYSQMNQFIHLLSYSNAGLPNDYWMPATKNAPPEFAKQFSVGVDCSFNDKTYGLSIIAYNKQLQHLITFKNGVSMYGLFDRWERIIEKDGKGKSTGIELLVQKLKGKTTGWISTTLSRSVNQFTNINNGAYFPFKYDRLLDVSLVVNHQIKDDITFSAVWNYGTGYPVTLAASKYVTEDKQEIIFWADRNSSRMRDYHRLDISVAFPYTIGQFDGEFTLSILNVYNRKNPYYYFYQNRGEGLNLYQQSLISILPSFSYSFKF